MNLNDYKLAAIRTESVIPRAERISPVALHAILGLVVSVAEVLDQVKKSVYYNRPYDRESLSVHLSNAQSMAQTIRVFIQPGEEKLTDSDHSSPYIFDPNEEPAIINRENLDEIDTRVLHAAIGLITESGEVAAAIRSALEGNKLDLVNLAEEFGDVNWYVNGIFPDAAEIPAGQTLDTNIAKLMKRFPDKFDGFLAQQENRNLEVEREVLEVGIIQWGRDRNFRRKSDGYPVSAALIGEHRLFHIHPSITRIYSEKDKAAEENDLNITHLSIPSFLSETGSTTVAKAGEWIVSWSVMIEDEKTPVYGVMSAKDFAQEYELSS